MNENGVCEKKELDAGTEGIAEVFVEVIAEEDVILPQYASAGAAGADVRAYLLEPITILPGGFQLVSTGLFMAIPEGYEIQVRPRSGLALKFQVTVLNAPGTIDSDYRGEIKIILINHGKNPFVVEPGMRIAQLVLAPVVKGIFTRSSEISSTLRGNRGFGHTGVL
ncbi:MAG: dUTP diphosphatase [Chlamydiales bacterium]|nr:dUTP diphosphatase [Chlamydiales bacterium]